MSPEPYTAVVAGATGAIGREVVRLLIDSPSCTQVTALVRSAASAEAKLSQTALGTPIDSAAKASKLKLVVEYDWEALCGQGSDGAAAAVFSGFSFAINCMGTTRKDAGVSACCICYLIYLMKVCGVYAAGVQGELQLGPRTWF